MSITDSNSVAIDDSIVLEYYPSRGTIVLGVATSVDGNSEDVISNQTIIQKKKKKKVSKR